jgi:hypothetical protein
MVGLQRLSISKPAIIRFFVFLLLAVPALAEMGVPIQLKLKSPTGSYPTEAGLSFKLFILSPTTNCILREENFTAQSINDGSISLVLGTGSRGLNDPSLSLNQVYDNSKAKTGLACVDANSNIISLGQVYTPALADQRTIRVTSTISGDPIVVNFTMRATPYAIQAESVGGKVAADIVVNNAASQMNQTNLNDLLLNSTRFNNLKNIAVSGAAVSAGSAVNFTGNLAGDVSGLQGSTSVDRIRGVTVSATAPTANQVIQYNGSQYVPATLPEAPVTSVAGRTGAVVLISSDISGLGNSASRNVGTAAGTVAAGDDSRITGALSGSTIFSGDVSGTSLTMVVNVVGGKSSAQVATSVNDTVAATALSTASTIVKRDASGNIAVNSVSSANTSTQNIYVFDTTNANNIRIKAPAVFANYVLTLPSDAGASGQVLATDGSGNLSWVVSNLGSVTAVSASTPLSSSGGATPDISISQSNATTAGFLSSADWSTFNNKQAALGYVPLNPANNLSEVVSATTARTNLGLGGAAVLNVGTAAATVAAGNDTRIVGALQNSAFNGYVASASCSTSETMYWNSVSGDFQCQSIAFPAAAVTSVAGRAGAVVLSSSDISGLGEASLLNVGSAAGTVAAGNDSRIVNALQTTSALSGDVSGVYNNLSVDKIQGRSISSTAPSTGQALVWNGSQWEPISGFPKFTKISSNQIFNGIGLTNVTGLSIAVTAGVTYKYKFNVLYTSAATTTGLKIGITHPAATTSSAIVIIPESTIDGTAFLFSGLLSSSGDFVESENSPAATPAVMLAKIEGVFIASANGTIQLQAATETGGSAIVIKSGSFVEIVEIP